MHSTTLWKFQIRFALLVLCCTFGLVHSYTTNLGPSIQPEAYFNGSGAYLRLQTIISLKKQTALSFRTCSGGYLFSQQQTEAHQIELYVNKDGVVFVVKTKEKQYEEKILGNFLDNKWHTVSLDYRLGNLTLHVDNKSKLIANASYRNELLTSPTMSNEGSTVLVVGKQFNGCLMEGPSLTFDESITGASLNVKFEKCPLQDNICTPYALIKGQDFCMNEPCMRHGTCVNADAGYTCNCLPRYTGKNCEFEITNICEKAPPICQNGGTCNLRTSGEYSCTCRPGYSGANCEKQVVEYEKCPENTCLNEAECVVNAASQVECVCLAGFAGKRCEINLDECTPNSCKNGGICHDGINSFTCDCDGTGYEGRFCENNVNECLVDQPCFNGGICFDTYGSYMCQCMAGFRGKQCQEKLDECSSYPCLNKGVCSRTTGGYNCECLIGYSGINCEVKNPQLLCDATTCLSFGECVDPINSIVCTCKPGFIGVYPNCSMGTVCPLGYKDTACESCNCLNGGSCGNVSSLKDFANSECLCPTQWAKLMCEDDVRVQCSDNPCLKAVSCQDYYGGYYCQCELGWTGLNCDLYLERCSSNPCKNGATCIEQIDYYFCRCPNGFQGIFCKTLIDGCASMPCLNDGICTSLLDGFSCNCTSEWMGETCEMPNDICRIKPCSNKNATCIPSLKNRSERVCCLPGQCKFDDFIQIDRCIGVKCLFGKKCINLIDRYECRCPLGYGGEKCALLVDQSYARDNCIPGITCQLEHNSHTSSACLPGYTGENCNIDIDECDENKGICNNGICQNIAGSFQCYCKPGYTGERCTIDFDECLSKPCKNNATCRDRINDFECVCPLGYEGKDCGTDIDECASTPCMSGSTCIDLANDFTCVCIPGLTGKTCDVNIDDCESSPCMNKAECIDELNNYTCNCTDTGYMGDHCEINIDDCVGDPCQNGAKCIDEVKTYRCACFNGYTDQNCTTDINECEENPCKNNGICLERSNITLYQLNLMVMDKPLPEIFDKPFDYTTAAGYECACIEGTTGSNCEIDIDECESSPCVFGTCEDQIGAFHCNCDDGYEGVLCAVNVDECEKYKPCAHGSCFDRKADYYCDCESNYGGKNCSVELTGCVNNPCLNNGSCKPYLINENVHKFNCTCPSGFHGATCEKVTTMSLTGKSLIMINTSREEGYDIQFRFKTTLSDGLLALGRGLTYYILELSKGRLNLHSSLLNKWEGVFIGSNLNDSNWQRVFVAINSTHLVLSANDEQTIYPITFNDNYNSTFTSFPLTYIGGTPSNLRKITHGQPLLVGCAEDVLVNGQWVLPEEQNSPLVTMENVGVGCERRPQCDPNPCYSGGQCTDLWQDFSCTCARPYLGHTCQYNYTAATFGYENITDSSVTVTVADYARRAVRQIVDISMFIRTRQLRGQIFYLGSNSGQPDETYIAAQLEGGELRVGIQFNGTPEAYTVSSIKLDNGYNHLIEVLRNVTFVQVKLNGSDLFRKTISATGPLDAQVLVLGGPPQAARYVRQAGDNQPKAVDAIAPTAPAAITSFLSNIYFKGIIQDVQISNGSLVMVTQFFPLKAKDLVIPPSFGQVAFNEASVLEGVHSDDLCRFYPCAHGGECENTWNDYRCNCTRGFKGKNCTDQEFCQIEKCPDGSTCQNLENGYECLANSTFDGKRPALRYGFATLENTTKPNEFNTLELKYRTRSWGTALYAKEGTDYFAIFIYHNNVIVTWRKSNELPQYVCFQKDHFDGEWITLLFYYNKDGLLRGGFQENVIDESPNLETPLLDYRSFVNIMKNGVIYVGSSDAMFDYQTIVGSADSIYGCANIEATTLQGMGNAVEATATEMYSSDAFLYKIDQNKTSDAFKGCLGEIRIGGLLLPYFRMNDLYKNHSFYEYFLLDPATKPNVGCILCHNDDCFNEGTCLNETDSYKCNCVEGYAADDCSVDINECENNQCENNSTCRDLIGRYECECLTGFEGANCEFDIDECKSSPCKNGGNCTDLVGMFKCQCPENFVGKQCEAPLLITCDNKPCKADATCLTGSNEVTGNNFTCMCSEGMTGIICDTPYCASKADCVNGYCDTNNTIPICKCDRGFEGKNCDVNINDCISTNGVTICQNGGICIDGINRYDCDCSKTGYIGLLCEMDIDECANISNRVCGRGLCVNTPGSYQCRCESKDKCGHFCSIDNPCETERPCVNGQCMSNCTEKSDYICNCSDNYTGKNCTQLKVAASQTSDGLNILYIVIPIVLILLVGFAVGMAILVNVARSKRATRGTYSPSAQEFCNPRVELDHVLKPPPEERLI